MIIIINSEASLMKGLGDIRELYRQHKFLRANVKAGKDRSLDQNAISHAWYQQLAMELREDDAMGWKCYCKLHHGVPILRAENDDFRAFYDRSIKGLSYEQKLQAMRFLPVTSLMTVKQLSAYLVAVQADFGGRGVFLMFPNEEMAVQA